MATLLLYWQSQALCASGPIRTWYLRYDQKFSNHCIDRDHLLMVPAEHDYRTANFSRIRVSGVINMTAGTSGKEVMQRAQTDALKRILQTHGLKSVKTLDFVTIISFEGMIQAPVQITPDRNDNENRFTYRAEVEFCPIPFPDQWAGLKNKSELKNTLDDFLHLFQ